MRKLPILFILLLHSLSLLADTSGYGCKIGQDYVYTEYLGMAPAYTGTAPIKYYKSTGARVPIYWGWGCNDCRGYRCGYINVYGATSYYDPDTGQNVPVEAENEFTYQGENCVIAPSLGATPVATDSYVYYSYNKTGKCGGNQNNVPLDDEVWVMLIATALLAVFFLKSKVLISH